MYPGASCGEMMADNIGLTGDDLARFIFHGKNPPFVDQTRISISFCPGRGHTTESSLLALLPRSGLVATPCSSVESSFLAENCLLFALMASCFAFHHQDHRAVANEFLRCHSGRIRRLQKFDPTYSHFGCSIWRLQCVSVYVSQFAGLLQRSRLDVLASL